MRKPVKTLARTLAFLSAGLSALYPFQIQSPAGAMLALPKALGAALAPLVGAMGAVGAVLGLVGDAPLATLAGALGAWASARHVRRVTAPHDGFDNAFGPDSECKIHAGPRRGMRQRRWTWWPPRPPTPRWQRDVPYRTLPDLQGGEARSLLCDIWQPPQSVDPSGLAVIYLHGSAWHAGDKDMLTRPFFRHLAAQGHLVMDAAYRLCPGATILDMAHDVQHAVAWLKSRAVQYRVHPGRIVLGGGSAGGHLALLVGYTSGHPQLTSQDLKGVDTSVCGVVAHYGAADVHAVLQHASRVMPHPPTPSLRVVLGMVEAVMGDAVKGVDWRTFSARTMIGNAMGGTAEEVPEMYELASPIAHVHADCPPTLLLQGAHDVIMPVHAARALHRKLVEAGVPAVYVEYPQTTHGFDLFIPQVSPSAQAATYDVGRFLALVNSSG